MEPIIDPVRKPLLKAELSQDRFLLESNRGGNLLYVVDNACAPNVVREIGRLREIAFRSRNSGTGKSCDLDRFDLDPAYHFHQLVLWDPAAEEIMGGYRFVCGDEVLFGEDGQPLIPSAHQFVFSEAFLQDGFRRTIELSRSFVALDFQNVQNSIRGVFALDSLLEGVKTINIGNDVNMTVSIGMGITAAGIFLLSLLQMDTLFVFVGGALVVVGVGFALFSSPNGNAIMSSVEPKQLGIASSIMAFTRIFGQAMSMTIVTLLLRAYVLEEMGAGYTESLSQGIQGIFHLLVIICCIGTGISLMRGRNQ